MTRQHDLEELRRNYKYASSHEKKLIERAAQRITKESGLIKDMRERLIKEHREGNTENIKDIHDFIEKKERYYNE